MRRVILLLTLSVCFIFSGNICSGQFEKGEIIAAAGYTFRNTGTNHSYYPSTELRHSAFSIQGGYLISDKLEIGVYVGRHSDMVEFQEFFSSRDSFFLPEVQSIEQIENTVSTFYGVFVRKYIHLGKRFYINPSLFFRNGTGKRDLIRRVNTVSLFGEPDEFFQSIDVFDQSQFNIGLIGEVMYSFNDRISISSQFFEISYLNAKSEALAGQQETFQHIDFDLGPFSWNMKLNLALKGKKKDNPEIRG